MYLKYPIKHVGLAHDKKKKKILDFIFVCDQLISSGKIPVLGMKKSERLTSA